MNPLEKILSSDILQAFGWTIIHSLWIGAVLFLITWILLHFFKNSKANFCYLISISSLAAFFILICYTFIYIFQAQDANYGFNLSVNDNLRTISISLLESANLSSISENFSWASIENVVNKNIPLLVLVWLLGLTFFSLRFFGGLIYIEGLKRNSIKSSNQEWGELVIRIKKRLGIQSHIQLKESSTIKTPMVIGFIKPIILFPLGIINGLPTQQVEAILFHEMAHIYRYDYLVNLFQTMVEVVFFYHPLVWWLSQNIRSERENICDDIAIKYTGNAIDYARALTNLQEINNREPQISMAFSNKKNRFMNRIRRLVGLPQIKNNMIEGIISSILLISSIFIFTTHSKLVFGNSNETLPSHVSKVMQTNSNEQESKSMGIPIKNNKLRTNNEKEFKELMASLNKLQKELIFISQKINENEKNLQEELTTVVTKENYTYELTKKKLQEQFSKSIKYSEMIANKLDHYTPILSNYKEKAKTISSTINEDQTTKLNDQLKKNEEMLKKLQHKLQNSQTNIKELLNDPKIIAKIRSKEEMDMDVDIDADVDMEKDVDFDVDINNEKKQQMIQYKMQKKAQMMQLEMEKKQQLMQLEMEKKQQLMQLEMEKMAKESQYKLEEGLVKKQQKYDQQKEKQQQQYLQMKEKQEKLYAQQKEKQQQQYLQMKKQQQQLYSQQKEKQLLLQQTFYTQLLSDKLIEQDEVVTFNLSEKKLTINGKKQSKKLLKKYKKIYADLKGETLADGKEIILEFN